MKEYLLFITFLAVANTVASIPLCSAGDEFYVAGTECYNFYACRNGVIELVNCPSPMLWNNDNLMCDAPENVQCEDEVTTVTAEAPTTEAPTTTLPPTLSPPSNTFIPEVEGALPILFPGSECPPDIRAFLIHATDCRRYYYCLYGIQYPQTCPFLETFNCILGHCVPRDQSECFPGSV